LTKGQRFKVGDQAHDRRAGQIELLARELKPPKQEGSILINAPDDYGQRAFVPTNKKQDIA
jgi:hypothetical protein